MGSPPAAGGPVASKPTWLNTHSVFGRVGFSFFPGGRKGETQWTRPD
jgi:hypothetical protein